MISWVDINVILCIFCDISACFGYSNRFNFVVMRADDKTKIDFLQAVWLAVFLCMWLEVECSLQSENNFLAQCELLIPSGSIYSEEKTNKQESKKRQDNISKHNHIVWPLTNDITTPLQVCKFSTPTIVQRWSDELRQLVCFAGHRKGANAQRKKDLRSRCMV